ncbi:MAG: DegV family protein [Clostridia bacterium]|nr:DegV family protein [Clostridia bacterium]
MADYKITCSSTVDIPAQRLKDLDIQFCRYHYTIDGTVYTDELDSAAELNSFYGKLKDGALPTTSPATPEEICALFEPILSAGYDLLHIEFSSGLSTSWKAAQEAREKLMKKYPDRKILIVDSLAASSGYGMLVEIAADYKRRGMGIEELRWWLEDHKLHVRHWFCSQNFMHFKRGGRISAATAVAGKIFNVCPILDVNDEGKLILHSKPIGKKSALKTMVMYMHEQALDGTRYGEKCYICHSMMEEDALTLKKMIESEFPKLKGKVEIHPIGAVIGSHAGTGTVALFFLSQTNRTR